MNYDLLLKLQKEEKYHKFLKANSNWYKEFNRDSKTYDVFVKEMKKKYKLRTIDKVDNIIDSVDIMSKILSATND